MPYTNDPANVPSDAVRFLVGDTKATADVSDSEVLYMLDEEGGNVLRAAARVAESLSARYTAQGSEKKVGPLSLVYGTRGKTLADIYGALAKRLWRRALSHVGPWAGGLSRADKQIRVEDFDRVQPAFTRRMQEYPGGSVVGGNNEVDLLSSAPETPIQ